MSGECNICGNWGCVEYNHVKWLKVTPSRLNQLIKKAIGYKFTLDNCRYEIVELDRLTGEVVVLRSSTGEELNLTVYSK